MDFHPAIGREVPPFILPWGAILPRDRGLGRSLRSGLAPRGPRRGRVVIGGWQRRRGGWAQAALCGLLAALGSMRLVAQVAPPSIPTTVTQEVFRSQWVAPQAPPQFDGQGSPGESRATQDRELMTSGGLLEALGKGIVVGPIAIHPGLAFGWEYSDIGYQSNGVVAGDNSTDNNSFFVAPSLALVYDREIGVWSVTAFYSAGIQYYLNKNYTGSGTGNQRNPFSQSGSLSVGHLGARHKFNLSGSASYGTGLDVTTGQNITQLGASVGLDWEYTLTTYTNIGVKAGYNVSLNDQIGGGTSNSALTSTQGSFYGDWLATGKTRLRLEFSAGQNDQNIDQGQIAKRTFTQLQASVKYSFTEKITADGGLGVRYVQSPDTTDAQYTGLLPSYNLSINYAPTEKTTARVQVGIEGADIRPSARLELEWQPRDNTAFSLAAYQNQSFSIDTTQQYQINRGVVGSVNQRLFSKTQLSLSVGYQQTENVNLSGDSPQSQSPYSYAFASATFSWNLNRFSSWQMNWWGTTNQGQSGTNGQNQPGSRFTVSFNLTF